MMAYKYTLGLDIGIASVGWSVVETQINSKTDHYEPQRIIDLGVRLFEAAEVPKTGGSLAEDRRLARGNRRRLHRRHVRLSSLRSLLTTAGILPSGFDLQSVYTSPWEIRATALDKRVSDVELAKALLHIAKRRGFKSSRKETSKGEEGGKYKESIDRNNSLLEQKGYRTYGEMFFKDQLFQDFKRNRDGNFKCVSPRDKLIEEIKLILHAQRKFGNTLITDSFVNSFIEIESFQRPFASGDQIVQLIGKCTFEPDELRAPKNAFSWEKFVFWQKVNNFTVGKQTLTMTQKQALFEKAINNSKVTYKDLRLILNLPEEYRFRELMYSKRVKLKDSAMYSTIPVSVQDAEKKTFFELVGYHTIRRIIEKINKTLWQTYKNDDDLLDEIAGVLSMYKTDEDIYGHLRSRVDDTVAQQLLQVNNFSKFGHLSLRAVRNITPFLAQGYKYDVACNKAGYDFNKQFNQGKTELLPTIDTNDVRNPAVLRSLTQARKVINAVIKRYGSPAFIHIELARELTRDRSERNKIKTRQMDNAAQNEEIKNILQTEHGVQDPKGFDILKYKLWKEQGGKCMYSQKYISPNVAFDSKDKSVEVDHILPFSRTLNDSYHNKALVLISANQDKKNQTPFEFIGKDVERWHEFTVWVRGLPISNLKKQNLLAESIDNKDLRSFISRDLNDTRYITTYLKNYLENRLLFAETKKKRKVYTFNGQFTAYLRHRYGLSKDRDANARHHALDATIVAIANQSMVQKVADYAKIKELYLDRVSKQSDKGNKPKTNTASGFPEPWPAFRDDIENRVFSDNPMEWIQDKASLSLYDGLDTVRPLFVSRMPRRSNTGPAHADTVYSSKLFTEGKVFKRVPIVKLKEKDLNNIYGNDTVLIKVLRERLRQYGNDPIKAFAEPIYKPAAKGKQSNPIRKVKLVEPTSAGVPVYEGRGIAMNDSMVRVDIFKKHGKFYIVPIYVADTVKRDLPNKAIVAHAQEEEWETMDSSSEFLFTLYPHDLFLVKTKKEQIVGYYVSTHRGSGSIMVANHDGSNYSGSTKHEKSVGIKTALNITKLQVDPLGYYTVVTKEQRHGFSSHRHQ